MADQKGQKTPRHVAEAGTKPGIPISPGELKTFLECLADSYNVTKAAKAIGRSRPSIYALRKRSEEFALAWDHALETAMDILEESLFERARTGKDTQAAIFLLKGGRSGRYLERSRTEVTGSDGGPIEYRELAKDMREQLAGKIAKLASRRAA